jgi:drug/metabolite transporter (DMT)-like permease
MLDRPIRIRDHARHAASFDALIGAALVFFWSSGFVVPHFFGPYVEPVTFVAARNVSALVLLAIIALLKRSPWPNEPGQWLGLMWAGAMFQGIFLMAGYWSIFHGLPVATAALIGALQPALTAICAAWLLGERISTLQIAGMALGLCGVGLVISPKFADSHAGTAIGLAVVCLIGVACAAYGSVYQKRYQHVRDDWSRTALIFLGAAILPVICAPLMETLAVQWSATLVGVYLWAVVALSIGGTMALLSLIQRGQAARAASLLYLVPPLSAAMAYVGFGERIHLVQVAGFLVAAAGVSLVLKHSARARTH